MENNKEVKELTIVALDRALDILVFIYKKGHPVHISDMAREMGQHKSTIYRALYTMEKKGFVTQNKENGTYWLGLKLLAIGSLVQEKMDITGLAHPYAKLLYDELQEVVNLSVLEIHAVTTPKIVVVYKEESEMQLLKANPSIGKFSECHSSAAGKCLLAFTDEMQIDTCQPFPLIKYTENTIVSWDRFIKEIQDVRRNGYALDQEEREYGLTCIGAPILDRRGKVIAALSIAGPSSRMNENMQYKIDKVVQTAALISRQLS